MPAAHLAGMFNAHGPNLNCLTACAASSQAIGEATEIIRRGDAEAMISGGTHSMVHPFGVTGFNLLTALSTSNDHPTKASRPFDRLRVVVGQAQRSTPSGGSINRVRVTLAAEIRREWDCSPRDAMRRTPG